MPTTPRTFSPAPRPSGSSVASIHLDDRESCPPHLSVDGVDWMAPEHCDPETFGEAAPGLLRSWWLMIRNARRHTLELAFEIPESLVDECYTDPRRLSHRFFLDTGNLRRRWDPRWSAWDSPMVQYVPPYSAVIQYELRTLQEIHERISHGETKLGLMADLMDEWGCGHVLVTHVISLAMSAHRRIGRMTPEEVEIGMSYDIRKAHEVGDHRAMIAARSAAAKAQGVVGTSRDSDKTSVDDLVNELRRIATTRKANALPPSPTPSDNETPPN